MDREKFIALQRGYWESQILFTATSAGIFDVLKEKARTADAVAQTLSLNPRSTEILLNALSAMKLLVKRKNAFRNGAFARKYLVVDGGESLTGFVLHNKDMWDAWGDLPSVVKTGKPRRGFAVLRYSTNKRSLFNFALAMHQGGIISADEIAHLFDFASVRSILDVGGCTGRYALSIMKQSLSDRVHILELPEMVREAKKIIRSSNREELKSIQFIEGDFFKVNPGRKFDLIILSNILHSLGENDCKKLISRLKNWLSRKGSIMIHTMTVERAGTTPIHASLFSVNMLVNTLKGRVYSERETLGMIKAAGMRKIDKKRTSTGNLVLLCS